MAGTGAYLTNYVASSTTQLVPRGVRRRVRGVQFYNSGAAGSFSLLDRGSGGNTVLTIPVLGSSQGPLYWSGEGFTFYDGIYVSISGGGLSVALFVD